MGTVKVPFSVPWNRYCRKFWIRPETFGMKLNNTKKFPTNGMETIMLKIHVHSYKYG